MVKLEKQMVVNGNNIMEKLISEVIPPGYERIRRYVIGQIAKAGDSTMRLASNREIARQFGVSHPTVVKALKDLIADGYLTVKPGCLGTFTNPGRFDIRGKAKIVGILAFDGKTVFGMRLTCEFFHAFTSELLRKSSCYKVQHCFVTGPLSNAAEELSSLGLDAVVWFFPTSSAMELLRELRESGMPVIIAGDGKAPDSSLYFDHTATNFNVAGRMLEEGRRKIMLAISGKAQFKEQAIEGMERAFHEKGLQFDKGEMLHLVTDDGQAAFAAKLKTVKPDGIVFNHNIMPVWKLVTDNLDIVSDCRLYAMEMVLYDDMDYCGYIGIPDIRAGGRHMVGCLEAQLEGMPALTQSPIEMKIEFKGNGGLP
jgi:hypothetical protein